MRELIVNEKTGFKITDPSKPVVIRDFRGMLFYTTEPVLPRVQFFNLPAFGKFFVDKGQFTKIEKPITYVVKKLPPVECRRPDPFNFEIRFLANPHKATIMFDKKIIVLDNAFKDAPLPKLYFIMYHEFAHQYYYSEDLADALAVNYMLSKGFNPEQIGEAQINTLSSKQYERKCFIVDRLINTYDERTNNL